MTLRVFSVLYALVIFACIHTNAAFARQIYHFHMGQGTAVTYATGPAHLSSSENEAHRLQRTGAPVFFASAPEARPGGSILFTHDNGHYHTPDAWIETDDRFVLEVWVKALESGNEYTSTPKSRGVTGVGTGGQGYYIVQRGSDWQVLTGGVGWVSIGEVTPGEWVHLALVADAEGRTVWKNGRLVGDFYRAPAVDNGFSVGTIGTDAEQAFHGEVYEVRLTRLDQAQFDPQRDFLLDYEQVHALMHANEERTRERIERIVRPGAGIRISDAYVPEPADVDFLIHPVDRPAVMHMVRDSSGQAARLILENGLISRHFYVSDNLASISYRNQSNGAEFLRAVKPEARLNIDGRWITIGGLSGQPEHSYLLQEWLPDMTSPSGGWVLADVLTGPVEKRYPWQQKFNARPAQWPPAGLHVTMTYEPPAQEQDLAGLIVHVHYELYDGIPVLSKWITLENKTGRTLVIEETETEILAVNQDQVSRLHVESDYAFALVNASPRGSALMHYAGEPEPFHAGESTTRWLVDPEYDTWASHNQAEDLFLGFQHYNMLVSRLPMGPSAAVSSGETFDSFRTFELLFDSDDRVRNTLAHRRLYRVLAPQVTESLLTAAITSHDTKVLKNMIDQMAELGFERLDIHPWPGVSHNNLDEDYVAHWREIADYAAQYDIIMGGYELVIASRGRGAQYDTVDPLTGEPGSLFGQSVCIATDWSEQYFKDTFDFFDQTGFRSWNADGPYHGDPCASESHAGHRGLHDSQWEQ